MSDSLGTMTTEHPRWSEFVEKLEGPEGCNFHRKNPADPDSITWECAAGRDKTIASRLLKQMGATDEEIAQSCQYFEDHGGFCDCEILFNVMDDETRRRRVRRTRQHRRRKE